MTSYTISVTIPEPEKITKKLKYYNDPKGTYNRIIFAMDENNQLYASCFTHLESARVAGSLVNWGDVPLTFSNLILHYNLVDIKHGLLTVAFIKDFLEQGANK